MRTYLNKNLELQFEYPDNWRAIENKTKNVVSVYDPIAGHGALQFSLYDTNNDGKIDPGRSLNDLLESKYQKFNIQQGKNHAFCSLIDDNENRSWYYWVIQHGSSLIFVSYNCEKEDAGKEENDVNRIIDSLQYP